MAGASVEIFVLQHIFNNTRVENRDFHDVLLKESVLLTESKPCVATGLTSKPVRISVRFRQHIGNIGTQHRSNSETNNESVAFKENTQESAGVGPELNRKLHS